MNFTFSWCMPSMVSGGELREISALLQNRFPGKTVGGHDLEQLMDSGTIVVLAYEGENGSRKVVGLGTVSYSRGFGSHVGEVRDLVIESGREGQGIEAGIVDALASIGRQRGVHAIQFLGVNGNHGSPSWESLGFQPDPEARAYRRLLA